MKKSLAVLFALSLAGTAFAQRDVDPRAGSRDTTTDETVTVNRQFPVNPDGTNIAVRMVDEIGDNTADLPTTGRKVTPDQVRVIVPDAVNLTYHGGDVMYELADVPGIWHEVCLQAIPAGDV